MSKPSTWEAKRDTGYFERAEVDTKEGSRMSKTSQKGSKQGKQIAELVKVLKLARNRILELHGNMSRDYSYETLNKIDNAIRKAEGSDA